MKQKITDYYNKNHREALLLLISIGLLILYIPKRFSAKSTHLPAERIQEFNRLMNYRDSMNNRWKNTPIVINEIDLDSLTELGLASKLAKSIIKYRSFGRKINNKKDLIRVYGMTDSIVSLMNIVYPNTESNKIKNRNKYEDILAKKRWQTEEIYINKISTDSLIALNLPKKLSERIIKYRDKINGFKNEESLQKTYGLTDKYIKNMNINYELPKSNMPSTKRPIKSTKPRWANVKIKINEISVDSLIELGIPAKLSNRIVKYRDKIGGFNDSIMFYKTYGLTEYYTNQLNVDYTSSKTQHNVESNKITTSTQKDTAEIENQFKKYENYKPVTLLDINIATREQLIAIYNIGEASANRILDLRDRLGGFYSIDQIIKIDRLHPKGQLAIKNNVEIKTLHKKIDLTAVDKDKLSLHPYISESQSDKITQWLLSHPTVNLEELRMTYIFSDLEWARISPYL